MSSQVFVLGFLALRAAIEESLLLNTAQNDDAREEAENKTWEDITSPNSLADVAVARLHCGIEMDKEARMIHGMQTRRDFRKYPALPQLLRK